ncbi:MAG: hypothetical protein GY953_08430, partial [bacterium]|nr:hypothetical protein [bacterium]
MDLPTFDVYGYRFTIDSTSEWAADGIGHDFAFFRSPQKGDAHRIEMVEADPDYESLPVCDASVYTPRNVVYRAGGKSYLDYSGRGLGVHDPAAGSFRIT